MRNIFKRSVAALLTAVVVGVGSAGVLASTGVSFPVQVFSASAATTSFGASKKKISDASITLSKTTCTYSGNAKKPGVTVKYKGTKLKKGTDYTISYSNNINAGTAAVRIAGKGKYTGSVVKKFTIKPLSLSSSSVCFEHSRTISIVDALRKKYNVYVYHNHKDITSSVAISIPDYGEAEPLGNWNYKITGKGNYCGTVYRSVSVVAPTEWTLIGMGCDTRSGVPYVQACLYGKPKDYALACKLIVISQYNFKTGKYVKLAKLKGSSYDSSSYGTTTAYTALNVKESGGYSKNGKFKFKIEAYASETPCSSCRLLSRTYSVTN